MNDTTDGHAGAPAAGTASNGAADGIEKAHEVLRHFRVIFSTVKRHSEMVEKQTEVSGAQLWALWELDEQPGLHVSELAAALSIHRSTASNLIDKMERKGLVRKERNGQDQRVVSLWLTDAGMKITASAPKPARGLLQETLRNLPADLLGRLEADLSELIAHLRVNDQRAAYTPLAMLVERDNNNNN